jgi:CXXX repeat peptide maturase
MMKFLIVPIDKTSISFCYYNNPNRSSDPEPVTRNILKRIVDYAKTNELTINFLYGQKEPPKSYHSIIESVSHVKIVPLTLAQVYPESIIVIESEQLKRPEIGTGRNVIVRLDKDSLPRFASFLPLFFDSIVRMNLCIIGLERITETELNLHAQQLLKITEIVAEQYRQGHIFELNFLSDRMILDKMKNCDAGYEHLTVGPDGRFYLCPGFLYDNEKVSVGSLTDGTQIPNEELLHLDHAPICTLCDAYHCKRCIYLNKKLTLEINTPSRQQCVTSHQERNASEKLMAILRDLPGFSTMKRIPAIDYTDPLILMQQIRHGLVVPANMKEKIPIVGSSHPPAGMNDLSTIPRPVEQTAGSEGVQSNIQSIMEMLMRIYNIQEEILQLLKKEHERQ